MDALSCKEEEPKAARGLLSNNSDRKLHKADRIRRSGDFRKVMADGRKLRAPHFVVRWCLNGLGTTRLGLTVSKKVGNSCARNRVKRRLREYFRHNKCRLPSGIDVVIIATNGSSDLKTCDIFEELNRALGQRF
ncbi:MAG: ribonuclease protein component [Thermodesulfobacteriota bacterium]|nr:ribonuclease protein component [Thermodesulfobacteriota bacterium]